MTDNWLQFFPFEKPRKEQIDAINFAIEQFKTNNNVVLEASTGIGKSAIAITLAKYYKKAWLITTQKILQTQYTNDFDWLPTVWSKESYECTARPGVSCRFGNWVDQILKKKVCDCIYTQNRNKFINDKISLTNMAYFLNNTEYTTSILQRNLLVIDECLRKDAKILIDFNKEVTIKHIFDNPNINYVISYNNEKNIYEKKKIIRKIRSVYDNNTQWYKIGIKYRNKETSLIVTNNHKMWTKNRGYIRADKLKVTDIIKLDTTHKVERYNCNYCDRDFSSKGLLKHIRTIIKIIKCQNNTCNNNIEIRKQNLNQKYCSHNCYSLSEKTHDNRRKHMLNNNPMFNVENINKMKKSLNYFWKNNPDKLLERKRNFINAPKYNKNKINNYENRLINIINKYNLNDIKYTGDGRFWVSFRSGKHKNPDFKIKNQRKVIEVGSKYWHNDNNIKDTINNYKNINFNCLYLTENELFNISDIKLYNILNKFLNNHDIEIKYIKKLKNNNIIKNKKYKYNLEIEDNHNYFANSILVSNCHNTDDIVSGFISIKLRQEELKFFNIYWKYSKDINEIINWIKATISPRLTSTLSGLKLTLKGKSKDALITPKGQKLVNQIDYLDRYICNLNRCTQYFDYNDWIMTINDGEYILRPLSAKHYAEETIFKYGNKRLLMSATILDKNIFCNNVGLDPKNTAFLSLPSPFDIKNRPIYIQKSGSMSRKNIEKTLPILSKNVRAIINEYPNDKGIIFTHNYKIANYIAKYLNNKRIILHDSSNRMDMYKLHLNSKEPTILISPSLTEGIDLIDDLSRFQIIAKIPFPYLGDKYVTTKMRVNNGWYDWMTAKTIVQESGRSIRHKDDWSDTFILDSDIIFFYKKSSFLFPNWYKNAMIFV